ncbi:MAG: RlpA-like double-psi beta-barrel domain-containing protein [Hyphomicrobium sp.]
MFPDREAPVDPVQCVVVLRRALRPLLRSAKLALACALVLLPSTFVAFAKTPGGVHCHARTCHRVSTLEEMDGVVGRFGILRASYYDDCHSDRFNTCALTSSGVVFRPEETDNAASPIFPDGTILLAFNPATRKAALLRVNSAGPYWGERKLDVSRAAAEKLGFRKQGVADLMIGIIRSPDAQEARYRKNRRYERVPGYIGVFPTFEAAYELALASLSLRFEALGREAVLQSQGRLLAAIEPEPELPVIYGRPNLRSKYSRQELRKLTIMYLESVTHDVSPLAEASPASDQLVRARAADEDVRPAEPAIVETVERVQSGAGQELVTHLEAPVVVVQAHDPAYWALGVDVTVNVNDFWHRLMAFVAEARRRAQPRGEALVLPPVAEWRPKLAVFVQEARAKARAGVTRSGPLYELLADLKSKAQAARD